MDPSSPQRDLGPVPNTGGSGGLQVALGCLGPSQSPFLYPAAPLSASPPLVGPPSAGLSSPTGSPMRNLIQTQFGTCLHIDCMVIKWLHLRRGRTTCISQLPSHGLGLATDLVLTVQSGIQGDRLLAASWERCSCLFKIGFLILGVMR